MKGQWIIRSVASIKAKLHVWKSEMFQKYSSSVLRQKKWLHKRLKNVVFGSVFYTFWSVEEQAHWHRTDSTGWQGKWCDLDVTLVSTSIHNSITAISYCAVHRAPSAGGGIQRAPWSSPSTMSMINDWNLRWSTTKKALLEHYRSQTVSLHNKHKCLK